MHLQAYQMDGKPMPGAARIPVESWQHQSGLGDPGSLTFDISGGRSALAYRVREKLRPWRSMVAVLDGKRVVAAGPVLRRKWAQDDGSVSVSCGDGMSFFGKRLVLNSALDRNWRDGEVVIDEDNPAPQWMLSFSGLSLAGIANGLLRETLKWGALPIDAPTEPLERGINERNYRCFDYATILDRLNDLQEVRNGPMMRCIPYLTSQGWLRFKFDPGFDGEDHYLSTTLEGHGIVLDSVDEDGGTIANEIFAMGGRDENVVLVARKRAELAGVPLLQEAVMSHTSVSRITTLQDHVNQSLVDGCTIPESTKLRARASHGIRPGDRLHLTTSNGYHGDHVQTVLNVVQVSGDESEWVSIIGFPESEI